MHTYLVGAAVLAVALLLASGIASVTTGWVMPLGRKRVLRPKLWGYGTLTSGIGMGVFLFVGPWGSSEPPSGLREAIAWCGWGVFFVGSLIQLLAQRPGRTPSAAPR
ncbi:hypothetical protein [Streptomyces sp. NPDC058964]|uniref:hypothetical protein n=1 Tax=Streptomyces sp. NPDC058964 TaxID=3346681 RepID=UPI003695A149